MINKKILLYEVQDNFLDHIKKVFKMGWSNNGNLTVTDNYKDYINLLRYSMHDGIILGSHLNNFEAKHAAYDAIEYYVNTACQLPNIMRLEPDNKEYVQIPCSYEYVKKPFNENLTANKINRLINRKINLPGNAYFISNYNSNSKKSVNNYLELS
jgi:hypothetical protein